ncbi:MAG: nickel-dependent hydrogenase large subunit [Gammaproteobacteria bacterium]|nr:nickel-dependent hydrogenase large subunit [Gammaproteobacteria bacterium]MDH5801931.1 nickel-dependent hydrogenase large subunit [Gammaproteobacteria bacterium]
MVRKKTNRISVPLLARVEGEGALDISIDAGKITDLQLRIFEPPRFFEKLLQGRHCRDVPDMVTRICGICPVAYQMSAVQALESLFQVDVGQWVLDMRRAYYCGEWLESHSLHIHLLALPDFLGYSSGPALAVDYPEEVNRGLRLQAVGNNLIRLFGARSVNPVGVRIGGFYKAPSVAAVDEILQQLEQAQEDAVALLHWCGTLPLPAIDYSVFGGNDQTRFDYVSVLESLGGDEEPGTYPMMGTELCSGQGLRLPVEEFEQYFHEHAVPHSTALHCLFQGQPYLVGPLARLNLFHHSMQLPVDIRSMMTLPSQNSYHSLLARAAEIVFAVQEAKRLLQSYTIPDFSYVDYQVKPGVGYGCTEAPRGLLWHRYEVAEDGTIVSARIVPPTSQNQAQIEKDLRESLEIFGLSDDREIKSRAEQIIRNYDPCISCATHFLDLSVQRQ